jgi:hypothetical protein
MKIVYAVSGRRLVMDHLTTLAYAFEGAIGAQVQSDIRADAQILANVSGQPVDICAAEEDGHGLVATVRPEDMVTTEERDPFGSEVR